MPAPVGFTQINAANIQDASGTKLAQGTLYVLPTDGDDLPITATAGGPGGPILLRPAPFAITAGALASTAWVPDTSLTSPQNITYRFTITDATGLPVYILRGVQPSGETFNLDTYSPDVPTQAPREYGPQGPAGTVAVGTVTLGTAVAITNVGTPEAAVLNFTLQKGDQGLQGAPGINSQVGNLTGTFGRQTYLANGTTTTFALPVAGLPLVFRNGILQEPALDYTQSAGTITMTFMPLAGDRITLVVFPAS